MTALRRVARNVANLQVAAAFYESALGFVPARAAKDDPELAACLGVARVVSLRLRRGGQEFELTQCQPAGAAYPAEAMAHDYVFQHIALLTGTIEAAARRAMEAGALPISRRGPQRLPAASGGVTAWKFRDPEGHPLELLQRSGAAGEGYDHSAISVSDAGSSVAFYASLGLKETARQLNRGAAQDRLDGLADVAVDVVALSFAAAPPHLELLHYRTPAPRRFVARPHDIAADRLVFGAANGDLRLAHDPDGHAVLQDGRD